MALLSATRHSTEKPSTTSSPSRLLSLLAVVYPLCVCAFAIALRFTGERWWLTTVALYLPRWPLLLPLPFLAAALLFRRQFILLAGQLLTLALILFPLMGLRVSRAQEATASAAQFRLLTYNVHGAPNVSALIAELAEASAEIILLQEAYGLKEAALKQGLPGYTWRVTGQFVLGSKYTVEEVFSSPSMQFDGRREPLRYARYRLRIQGRSLDVYSVHPSSPRFAMQRLRREAAQGDWFHPAAIAELEDNSRRRLATIEATLDDAHASDNPVLVAGDTNLPTLSYGLSRMLGRATDAFDEVGNGFGYTFPADRGPWPWMRIDRVFTTGGVRFLEHRVRAPGISDHLAVIVTVEFDDASR